MNGAVACSQGRGLSVMNFGNMTAMGAGSSLAIGGINATNAYDFQALSSPGVQLKEAVLPAPMGCSPRPRG